MNRGSWLIASALLLAGCHDFDSLVDARGDATDDGDDTDAGNDAAVDGPNLRPSHLDAATLDVLFPGDAPELPDFDVINIINTDTKALTVCSSLVAEDCVDSPLPSMIVVAQNSPVAKEIAVLVVARLELTALQVLNIRGARPLAIVATDDIIIRGRLLAIGVLDVPGPGGLQYSDCDATESKPQWDYGAGTCGSTGPAGHVQFHSGGGGGGNAGAGGQGGGVTDGDELRIDASPGGAVRSAKRNEYLVGGGGGGSGGPKNSAVSFYVRGGGGGGAVQLTSNTKVEIGAGGIFSASGGGGWSSGWDDAPEMGMVLTRGGGGGGGAGGMAFIEAPVVVVDGIITANGGAGGGGDVQDTGGCVSAQPGADGLADDSVRAAGGASCGSSTSAGGDGSGGDADEENGLDADDISGTTMIFHAAGGGGGGGAGRIVILSESGTIEPGEDSLLSPSPFVEMGKIKQP